MLSEKKLAALFIQYAEAKEKTNALEAKIKEAVLEVGESRKIAGIAATYYNESNDVDYEGVAKEVEAPKELVDAHSTVKVTVSWKSVVDELREDGAVAPSILEAHTTIKPARVVVK